MIQPGIPRRDAIHGVPAAGRAISPNLSVHGHPHTFTFLHRIYAVGAAMGRPPADCCQLDNDERKTLRYSIRSVPAGAPNCAPADEAERTAACRIGVRWQLPGGRHPRKPQFAEARPFAHIYVPASHLRRRGANGPPAPAGLASFSRQAIRCPEGLAAHRRTRRLMIHTCSFIRTPCRRHRVHA